MNILIVGCGKVGSKLANNLSKEGYDVSVVDKDEENFLLLDEDYTGLITLGVPIDIDILRKAGIENCDAIACMTPDDNINIMVSQLAREVFNVPSVLARIYDPQREDVFSHFGLHTVCPTNLTVSAVKSALTEPHSTRTLNFGSHTTSFITVDVTKNLVGENVNDLDLPEHQSVLCIIHNDLSVTLFKGQDIILNSGDKLIIAELVD